MLSPKPSPAPDMIFKDYLTHCLARTSTSFHNANRSKYVPRNKHTAMGDFPKEYMPRKGKAVDVNVGVHEVSQAATASSKTYAPNSLHECRFLYRQGTRQRRLVLLDRSEEGCQRGPWSEGRCPLQAQDSCFRVPSLLRQGRHPRADRPRRQRKQDRLAS